MARFELPIYGADDELIRKFEADRVRWGTLVEAVGLAEDMKKMSAKDQIASVGRFLKNIFPNLADEDLAKADYLDVMNTFNQLVKVVEGIKAGEAKNG